MLKRKRSEIIDTSEDHHIKNPYRGKTPDFADLKRLYPNLLGSYVRINSSSGKGFIDFTDTNANIALTRTLLQHDFNINVTIPDNNLCPPLPNRINYLCWLSDLIDSLPPNQKTATNNNIPRILDIGVGPVGIYPILGNKLFGWDFVGTDIDDSSVQHCQQNINVNTPLNQAISIHHVEDCTTLQQDILSKYLTNIPQSSVSSSLLHCTTAIGVAAPVLRGPVRQALWVMGPVYQSLCQLCEATHTMEVECSNNCSNTSSSGSGGSSNTNGGKSNTSGSGGSSNASGCSSSGSSNSDVIINQAPVFTASMCNPPFYDLEEQILPAEHTICTGSTSEMRTLGGEVAFICAIIADSLILRDKVIWYTTMVGKKASLRVLLRILQQEGVPRSHIFTTRLRQGRTHRWCLAWTFSATAAVQYTTAAKSAVKLTRLKQQECSTNQSGDCIIDSTTIRTGSSSCAVQLVHTFEITTTLSDVRASVLPSDRDKLGSVLPIVSDTDHTMLMRETELSLLLCRVLAAMEETFTVFTPNLSIYPSVTNTKTPADVTTTTTTIDTTTNTTIEVGVAEDTQSLISAITLFLHSMHCIPPDRVTLLYHCNTHPHYHASTTSTTDNSNTAACTVKITVSVRPTSILPVYTSTSADRSDSNTVDQEGVVSVCITAATAQLSTYPTREYWVRQQEQLAANLHRNNRRWRRIIAKQQINSKTVVV